MNRWLRVLLGFGAGAIAIPCLGYLVLGIEELVQRMQAYFGTAGTASIFLGLVCGAIAASAALSDKISA